MATERDIEPLIRAYLALDAKNGGRGVSSATWDAAHEKARADGYSDADIQRAVRDAERRTIWRKCGLGPDPDGEKAKSMTPRKDRQRRTNVTAEVHQPPAALAHNLTITEEVWQHALARYGKGGVAGAMENAYRAQHDMPPRPPVQERGRFTSERNPRKKP